MRFPASVLVRAGFALAFLAGAASAEVPEPHDYWMGPMHSEVPATLSGARVVDTKALALILEQGEALLIDAAEVPRRPENLAQGAIWKPVHQHIKGSIWIPGIGAGKIEPRLETYYRERLTALTANNQGHLIILYCHPQCWASWNAAKRALSYGYRNIAWYRDGAEGWQDTGHTLVAAEPEHPTQFSH
ncbi:MAG: rhodanese-like domain-containing protein [Beijerinckiaceae bacterium]|nr:rhodanese-like domain-containing protein [Beijerinckiaceae bacterium]MCI0735108.1 rhodanese-like domain-containing protein [Beijerinckiaceae bacterium]